ncbi:hypothetical protein CH281_18715 [Rhodococcus sp. 06-221-2]|uniref:acyl-CoA dehydrogenase family protein n=1 Tax=Nocardiaceae TaxID=85025 RepID=UPI000B9B9FB7|nr:acyl-CoA dehydrogenase family protein [Rhodococcus sp. 06-221-2]NIL85887.1 putative acyl-CoA dehydrogenase FadE17 [Rhodococcus fascians]OZD00410.1 hypothetical protein CH281_18715 [Rhodococcus sp. 06-221-2]
MDYAFSSSETELRSELRELIGESMPPDYPGIFVEDFEEPLAASWAFCRKLGAQNLLTRAWPRQYGGDDASVWSQVVFNEEMWAHNEPRGGQYMGVTWIGPALITFGNKAQREQHLPGIASGDVQWCQGFSEPDAGSDLASLTTRATMVDGGFRVDGQKVWTSYASHAQYCVLAARTSVRERKQDGLTVFLVPMDREGITVRRIPTMLGPNHFHEVFFDDVFVDDAEVLGTLDHGWEIMTAGLAFERVGIPRYARADRILAEAREVTRGGTPAASPDLAAAMVHVLVARLLNYRNYDGRVSGEETPAGGPIARIASTLVEQEVADVAMDMAGVLALTPDAPGTHPALGHLEHHWRYAQAATVAAGALEIQKMLVGRRLLSPRRG